MHKLGLAIVAFLATTVAGTPTEFSGQCLNSFTTQWYQSKWDGSKNSGHGHKKREVETQEGPTAAADEGYGQEHVQWYQSKWDGSKNYGHGHSKREVETQEGP